MKRYQEIKNLKGSRTTQNLLSKSNDYNDDLQNQSRTHQKLNETDLSFKSDKQNQEKNIEKEIEE